ncbi:hypothetical protein [Erwinia sp. MYb416]|uniref:hypothetical protein n=1 Tax=Erwinia sp. MYb416 TaxID=3108532 RepID=UPI0030AFA69F
MLNHHCARDGAVFSEKGNIFSIMNVNKSLIIIFLSLFFCSMQVQGRTVIDIDIKDVGQQSQGREDKNEEEACKVFIPNKKQMIRFFNLAKEYKKSGSLLHEYYSPCVSSGSVKFKDGSSGDWTVQSSGLAFAILDNGESLVFFHKDNQWTDPYACTYGLQNDPIC